MPGRRERARLGLAVADDAGDDQPRVVERRAEGVAQRIAELAALVDRTRRGGRHVARNAAREGELGEQLLQPILILADVGIDLAVAALEIGVGHQRRAAMAGAGDVEHVEIVRFDHPVQVDVDEVLTRRGAPMPHHQRLDMRKRQRLPQQRIVIEVDLPGRQVVCGPPIGVHEPQLGRQCRFRASLGQALVRKFDRE